jgi:putative NADPH-quinone reductase
MGYAAEQALEPGLALAQKLLKGADHVAWFYPNWWGGPPALVKGFIDRALLPGFAFRHKKRGFPEKLLSGKTTELTITMDTPPWVFKWLLGAPGVGAMKSAVLRFCGLKVARVRLLGPVRGSSPERRAEWLRQVASNFTH